MSRRFYVESKPSPLQDYNPLLDPDLTHYWSYPSVRTHLTKVGFIGNNGSVIDINKYRASFSAVEHQMLRDTNRADTIKFHEDFEAKRARVLLRRSLCEKQRLDDIHHLKEDLRRKREVLGSEGGNPLSVSKITEYRERLRMFDSITNY